MTKATRLNSIENKQSRKREKVDYLAGLNPFEDLVEQVELKEIHPANLYQAIREAQQVRVKSIESGFLDYYSDKTLTLTIPEKNFVYVHEQDIRSGILRRTALETQIRINEMLREQKA